MHNYRSLDLTHKVSTGALFMSTKLGLSSPDSGSDFPALVAGASSSFFSFFWKAGSAARGMRWGLEMHIAKESAQWKAEGKVTVAVLPSQFCSDKIIVVSYLLCFLLRAFRPHFRYRFLNSLLKTGLLRVGFTFRSHGGTQDHRNAFLLAAL